MQLIIFNFTDFGGVQLKHEGHNWEHQDQKALENSWQENVHGTYNWKQDEKPSREEEEYESNPKVFDPSEFEIHGGQIEILSCLNGV